MGIDDKIASLQEKLDKTPKNKGTEKERARLKARIASLKEEKEQRATGTGAGHGGYSVKKQGDATVALVGPPSVGKSTLLNQVTDADSEVAAYEFTTLDVIPGMYWHRGAHFQLLDVPGLIGGAAGGKGGGKQVLSVIRNADMVLMMTSPEKIGAFDKMEQELYDAGVRIDTEPPAVKIAKKDRGGLDVKSTVDQPDLDMDTIKEVLRDRGYVNAYVVIRQRLDVDLLIDAISSNRVYMPSMKALNKADTVDAEERSELEERFSDAVFISAETGEGIETLKEGIFETLELIRIYMKEPGKDADIDEPLIIKQGSSIMEVCERLPGNMEDTFKQARIWGESAAFPEQRVGGDHVLSDGDIVEIRTR